MKKNKFAALLLCGLLAVSATGCSLMPQAPAPTPAPAATEAPESTAPSQAEEAATPAPTATPTPATPVPEESTEPGGESENAEHPENAGTESGELPVVEGDPAFVAAFTGNEIDSAYLNSMENAVSVTEMVQAANTATAAWETQINYGFTQLTDALEGEAKENEVLEQAAWSNELSIAKNEITENAGSEGSAANLDVAYQIMLLYRSRTVTIFEKLYAVTGEVNFHTVTGEAVG